MYTKKITVEYNDIEIIEDSNNYIKFILKNITTPYAKILSDIMYERIPTMAIDKIHVISNNTSLVYELIAHRIALIPIHADATKFEYFNGIDHTTDNTIKFRLKKSGNDIWDIISKDLNMQTNVLSGDLKWEPEPDQEELYDDIRVSDPNYLILKLKNNQGLEMLCYAIKGTGKDHTKFSPISIVGYRPVTDIKPYQYNISMISSYPWLTTKLLSGELTINDLNVLFIPTDYIFEMSTKGQMLPTEILNQAIKQANIYMELPYRERKDDIGIPGYLY
uniref:RPB3 subunit of eukaryotic RNA polymerase II n=1 Tax=Pithovirus LCPAC102 TaxID=2506587 RepID=A0A4D5XFA7_9VIRU|nr:MAG: RPB3 subunit of eukaryotic RNA polymerase II [Pithovirus LCPAC102]